MKPMIPYFEVVEFPVTDGFALQGFGLMVFTGVLLGSWLAVRKAHRDGADAETLNGLVGWTIAGIFIGGHLGHLLFYYPETLLENPMELFMVHRGLSSFGGFIGCFILGFLYIQRRRKERKKQIAAAQQAGKPHRPPILIWALTDCGLYGFTLGWFFGRMGCFVAHDHPGTITNFALGVKGMLNPNFLERGEKVAWHEELALVNPELAEGIASVSDIPDRIWQEVGYHDLGLYEALWALAMFLIFMALDRKKRFPGFFTAVLFISYGLARFPLDMLRHVSTDTRYLGLTPAQYFSVATVALGVWMYKTRMDKPHLRDVRADWIRDREAFEAAEAAEAQNQ